MSKRDGEMLGDLRLPWDEYNVSPQRPTGCSGYVSRYAVYNIYRDQTRDPLSFNTPTCEALQ